MGSKREFVAWLQTEMDNRRWNQTDLARESRLSAQAVNNVMTLYRAATVKFCNGIANAFKIAPSSVMVKAGLLSPRNESLSEINDLVYKYSLLNKNQQKIILDLIEVLIKQNQH